MYFFAKLESIKIVKYSEFESIIIWKKVSELESVRVGKCQIWKVSELESVRAGKCQNQKVLESVGVGIGVEKVSDLISVRIRKLPKSESVRVAKCEP